MKALSLWQPWASLMAIGAKRIETRHWSTAYRGEVAIHAAKRWTGEEKDLCTTEPFYSALIKATPNGAPHEVLYLPLGAIVAVGELVDVFSTESLSWLLPHAVLNPRNEWIDVEPEEREFGNYEPGRYGWVFRNVRRLATPIPYRGQQGLWTLEPAIVEQINQEVSARV